MLIFPNLLEYFFNLRLLDYYCITNMN